jgi:sugar lactone lactonase YvrE
MCKFVELLRKDAAWRTTIDRRDAAHSLKGRDHMLKGRFALATLACVGLAIAISTTSVMAWKRGSVQNFAVLPSGAPMVEGLTVGKDGNIYTPTFDLAGPDKEQSLLFTFDPQGHLLNKNTITNSSRAMLGLAFYPGMDALLVIDFVAAQVLSVHPETGAGTSCITLPPGNAFPKAGLNALTFDRLGNIYISDSFQGVIWRRQVATGICGPVDQQPWAGPDPLLLPSNGVPGFGANGIEFNKNQTAMFVANTAMDWIVKIPVTTGPSGQATPSGQLELFTNSINGADGIVLDNNDNIWVAANQADEIVVVDPTGKAIAKLGDFDGVQGGVTNGLLFPASPAFSKDGNWLYVTNLELDLRTIGGPQTVDSQWAADVDRHSIARLKARIPPIQ